VQGQCDEGTFEATQLGMQGQVAEERELEKEAAHPEAAESPLPAPVPGLPEYLCDSLTGQCAQPLLLRSWQRCSASKHKFP